MEPIIIVFIFLVFLLALSHFKSSPNTPKENIKPTVTDLPKKPIPKKHKEIKIEDDINFDSWIHAIESELDGYDSLSDLLRLKKPSEIYYGDLLQCFEWKYKRFQILFRDNYKCQDCGKRDVSNHVHHNYYLDKKLPWDIENDALETLCRRCHTKRHQQEEIPVFKYVGIQKVEVSREDPTCGRCDSTGYIYDYKHIEGGICFKCRGNLVRQGVFIDILENTNNSLDQYDDEDIRTYYRTFLNKVTYSEFSESVPNYSRYIKKPTSSSDSGGDLPF